MPDDGAVEGDADAPPEQPSPEDDGERRAKHAKRNSAADEKAAAEKAAAEKAVPTPVQLPGKPVKNRREIWDCLGELSWKSANVKTKTFGEGSITLGVTRGAPRADGFDSEGYNDQVVPACLSQNDREQCAKLWKLLQDEGQMLGFKFSSVQLNKNFQAMWRHHHRRTDKDHQWCLSLGDFTGGEFVWEEGVQCFSVSTKDRWQKVDGRHVHWVLPHQPEASVRYSIVLFRNKGDATELFYHSAVLEQPLTEDKKEEEDEGEQEQEDSSSSSTEELMLDPKAQALKE